MEGFELDHAELKLKNLQIMPFQSFFELDHAELKPHSRTIIRLALCILWIGPCGIETRYSGGINLPYDNFESNHTKLKLRNNLPIKLHRIKNMNNPIKKSFFFSTYPILKWDIQ